jgi:hypothetical protein
VSYHRGDTPGRPPVLLGCGALLGILVLLVSGGVCAAVFLESGADSGMIQLQDAGAYAPGSVEFVSEFNLFIVRDLDGNYHALDDLDAANRASQSRRCRVQAIPAAHPDFARLRVDYNAALSPPGRRLSFLFREDCNGALYDGAGVRLNASGERNLDRFAVSEASNGRLEVSTGERICTQTQGPEFFAPLDCD